jgi:hypothetical protein
MIGADAEENQDDPRSATHRQGWLVSHLDERRWTLNHVKLLILS